MHTWPLDHSSGLAEYICGVFYLHPIVYDFIAVCAQVDPVQIPISISCNLMPSDTQVGMYLENIGENLIPKTASCRWQAYRSMILAVTLRYKLDTKTKDQQYLETQGP